MVEKIIINPVSVRGYGNVLDHRTSEDFIAYLSSVVDSETTIAGVKWDSFILEYSPHNFVFGFDKAKKRFFVKDDGSLVTGFTFDSTSKALKLEADGVFLGWDDTNKRVYADDTEYSLTLTASNPYFVSGETTNLIVTLLDENGAAVSGKTVTITDGTSIYTGTTDNSGQYTKTGVTVSSDTTYTATYSNASDTAKVEYCLFKDYGVTGKSNLSNIYYEGETTVTTEGTLFECNDNNRWALRPDNFGLFDTGFEIDFKVVSTSGRFALYGYNSSTSTVFTVDTYNNIRADDDIRITITDTTLTFYHNGVQLGTPRTYTSVDKLKLQLFFNQASTYLEYKDFRIKPL